MVQFRPLIRLGPLCDLLGGIRLYAQGLLTRDLKHRIITAVGLGEPGRNLLLNRRLAVPRIGMVTEKLRAGRTLGCQFVGEIGHSLWVVA